MIPMKNPKLEGLKTSVRMICLAVLGFVIEAVSEKLTRTNLPLKEILIPVLIYFDKFVFEKKKEYQARRFDVPFWLNFKMPF